MSWGRPGNSNFKYVKKDSTPTTTTNNEVKPGNQAKKYAQNLARSDFERLNGELQADLNKVLSGGCVYLPNFYCKTDDLEIFNQLKAELDKHPEFNMVKWSQHYKHENPDFSATFNKILKQMSDHFDVEVTNRDFPLLLSISTIFPSLTGVTGSIDLVPRYLTRDRSSI